MPRVQVGEIVPRGQDFATVGHLYRSIEAGIAHLAEKLGEEMLFVGPSRAQATQQYFGWPELVAVTDVASAQRAIDEILEQGEGPRGHWRDAHFGQFVAILEEYLQLREANPAFDPVRPVVTVNVRPSERDTSIPLATDPITRQVMDLFNVSYEILLLMLQRFFAHTEETDPQLKVLADASVNLMFGAIEPLGDLVTTLPAGQEYPGRTAGPSFELFYESDYVLPHREAAWAVLVERTRQAADFCEPGAPCGPEVGDGLRQVRANLTEIADALAVHLPARYAPQPPAGPPPAEDPAPLLARASDYSRTGLAFAAGDDPALSGVAALLASAYQARPRQRPPHAGPPRRQRPAPPSRNPPRSRPVRPSPARPRAQNPSSPRNPSRHSGVSPSLPPPCAPASAPAPRPACSRRPPRCRTSRSARPQPGERPQRLAELGQLQRELPPAIMTAKNGPYLVTNVTVLRTPLGEEVPVPPQLALCRCGASAIKPFCDGSHTTSGFTDGKDPNRVPDQRDTYPGQQVTIFDNRGICQHSGLCSDRVPTAFRTGAEPFVAPSGGRLDELVRAVRDCPSGALSLGFDGPEEQRDLADWHGTRERAIEVTQDGPYRVTGAIPVTDATGADVSRAAGSSREHFALCRCGHSQNKPFCSGMHWYVDFRDPAGPADPTLFEWAGGLPALTRMTRLLYEKHVPADDLLAPLFADMAPDRAQREAAVIGAAFSGPAAPAAVPARVHRGAARPLGGPGCSGRRRGRLAGRPAVPFGPRLLPGVELAGRRRTGARLGLGSRGPAGPRGGRDRTGRARDPAGAG